VFGYTSSCAASRGPRSLVSMATTAARFPPALSPPTAIRPGSAPSPSAFLATHSTAARQSSTAAGNGCSGASR
jgi:hypothetical protein